MLSIDRIVVLAKPVPTDIVFASNFAKRIPKNNVFKTPVSMKTLPQTADLLLETGFFRWDVFYFG